VTVDISFGRGLPRDRKPLRVSRVALVSLAACAVGQATLVDCSALCGPAGCAAMLIGGLESHFDAQAGGAVLCGQQYLM
jgi:hypothetical protein